MKMFIAIILLTLTCGVISGQSNASADESDIRNVITSVEKAWAAGDGEAIADNFTDEIDFTVWNGLQYKGRAENIRNHQRILDTFYKGTRVVLTPIRIRFLSKEIAVVHLKGKLFRGNDAVKTTPPVVPLMVFVKTEGKWKIDVFQNTPVIQRGELVLGRKPKS